MSGENSATIHAIDSKRMRLGMRNLAVNIVSEMIDPKNASLWHPEKAPNNHRIGPSELVGSLGNFDRLWEGTELDASARIIHMTYLAANLIKTGVYDGESLLEDLLECQAGAELVRKRLKEKGIG